jgi:peptidoglycan/LPS O-acetylase OafA/YrhL
MSPLFVWQGVKATHVIRYALMALCYLTNVTSLWVKNSPGIFSNTWSLACEEHFYIVWSLLLPFVCRASPRLRVPLIAGLIAASLSLRIYTGMYPGSFFGAHYYFNSFNNFWKMLLGASLRLVPIPPRFLKRRWAYIGLGGMFAMLAFIAAVPSKPILTFLATLAPGWKDYKAAIRTWTDPIVAVCSLLIICGSHDAEGGPKILESQLLRFTGRISYAWYLWQLPLIDCFGGKISGKPIAYGNTAIAFMVAMFSTVYVEEPIRATYVAWKKRRSAREMSIEFRMS